MQSLLYAFRWLVSTTLPAGRVLGIPLRVHLLLVLLMLIGIPVIIARAVSSPSPLFTIGFALAFIVQAYISILLHELGHAWGFRLVGGRTDTIILTPVGGLAMGMGAGLSPRAELLITALGPAVTVVIAVAAHLALWMLPDANYADGFGALDLAIGFTYMVAMFNTMVAIFNLVTPLFPLDCARLLRAGLSLKYNPGAVTYRICQVGIGLGIFMVAAMFLDINIPFYGPVSPWLALIGILGLQACLYEMERIKYGPVYEKSDQWGARTVFYDHEDMARAKARAFEDIGGLLKRKPAATVRKKRPRRSGPAKIIDISDVHEPERISDMTKLQQMMKDAADQEDFTMAARVQKRIKELKDRAEGNHKTGE